MQRPESSTVLKTGYNLSKNRTAWIDALMYVLSDFLFIILPLVVVALVIVHKEGTTASVLSSPEWSFASAVLFGQAAVKMIAVAATGVIAERASVFGALAIVLGLVPSLILLSFLLNDEHHVSAAMRTGQMLLFILASLTYALFAATAHYARERAHSKS
jgi:hypothetical protein